MHLGDVVLELQLKFEVFLFFPDILFDEIRELDHLVSLVQIKSDFASNPSLLELERLSTECIPLSLNIYLLLHNIGEFIFESFHSFEEYKPILFEFFSLLRDDELVLEIEIC